MAPQRTKVDRAAEQRKRLDERRLREQRRALNSTFAALPNLEVPSRDGWEHIRS